MNISLPLTVEICGSYHELTAEVVVDYTPAERGCREPGTGMQMEPDYDESFEVHSVTVLNTDITHLLDSEQHDAIAEHLREMKQEGNL